MSIVINGKKIANYTEISTNTSLGTSDTKVPSENAVKTYVDDIIQDLEITSNKTTIISSSSTDTQYPSAKCVYDAIQEASGGIEYAMVITDYTA